MNRIEAITLLELRDVVQHQDQNSIVHAHDKAYYSAGITLDRWLEGVAPHVGRIDLSTGEELTEEEFLIRFRKYTLAGTRPDRPRELCGYKVIYNPNDDVQSLLRALRFVAPKLFVKAHQFLMGSFGKILTAMVSPALMQRAFHSDSGRWHREATVCKYDSKGMRFDWAKVENIGHDKPETTALIASEASHGVDENPKWGMNTKLEVRITRAFYRYYEVELEPELRRQALHQQYMSKRRESLKVLKLQAIRREQALLVDIMFRQAAARREASSKKTSRRKSPRLGKSEGMAERVARRIREFTVTFGHPPPLTMTSFTGLVSRFACYHFEDASEGEDFIKSFRDAAFNAIRNALKGSFPSGDHLTHYWEKAPPPILRGVADALDADPCENVPVVVAAIRNDLYPAYRAVEEARKQEYPVLGGTTAELQSHCAKTSQTWGEAVSRALQALGVLKKAAEAYQKACPNKNRTESIAIR